VSAWEAAVPVRIHVAAPDPGTRNRLLAVVRSCGFEPAAEPDGNRDTTVVAAARTVDDAIAQCPAPHGGSGGWLLIAETFTTAETLRAVRTGARAMLRSANVTAERFAGAVDAARRGDGLLPYEVLVGLLGEPATGPCPSRKASVPTERPNRTEWTEWTERPLPRPDMTGRQLTVLALMAEGHDNATIARELHCSQHTVRNVIYGLTAQLQVHNRAQAVACAVRAGLI
jgi:DNA-binding NarL/FixJ family response regulator